MLCDNWKTGGERREKRQRVEARKQVEHTTISSRPQRQLVALQELADVSDSGYAKLWQMILRPVCPDDYSTLGLCNSAGAVASRVPLTVATTEPRDSGRKHLRSLASDGLQWSNSVQQPSPGIKPLMNLFTETVSKCVDNFRTSRFFEARLGFPRDACRLGNVLIYQVGLTGCIWQSGIVHRATHPTI